MRVLYDIQDMLEDELKKICKQDTISTSDLDEIDKMVDIIKDISTIDAMEHYDGGYSYADATTRGYSESWPYSYEGRGGRLGGNVSNARGRDTMGRYTSRDSGHDKNQAIDILNNLMMDARNEEDREKYRKAIEQLNR